MPPAGREALGWRVFPCPTEKPAGTPLCACQGRNTPCSPLSPVLPLLWRVLESSNGHHGETGSETMWHSWGELWHCQRTGHGQSQLVCRQLLSTGILPSQGHQPASGQIPGSSSGRRGAALPVPGTVRLAHGWREHRALGHPGTPTRGGTSLPPNLPLPPRSHPGAAGPVPLATWLLPPAWITSLSVFFNFS